MQQTTITFILAFNSSDTISSPITTTSQHLVSQCVLLGGRCDAEQPEDCDADYSDRTGRRVEPQQVRAVHREAGHEHRR